VEPEISNSSKLPASSTRVNISQTDIMSVVRVLVMSEQMTLVQPRVSAEAERPRDGVLGGHPPGAEAPLIQESLFPARLFTARLFCISSLPPEQPHDVLGHVALWVAGGEVPEGAHGRLGDLLTVPGRDDGPHQRLDPADLAHCHLVLLVVAG
jgi:hypothetical protein